MTSGRAAISSALSIISSGVTQTGQPGPWMSVICLGSSSSMPNFTMACVWPPQTSMMFHGCVVIAMDFPRELLREFAVAIFVEEFHGPPSLQAPPKLLHLLQILEDLVRLVLVHLAEREADMHDHVIARPCASGT